MTRSRIDGPNPITRSGFEGGFVEPWDALFWLIAFVFIEMYFFEWHEEAATA